MYQDISAHAWQEEVNSDYHSEWGSGGVCREEGFGVTILVGSFAQAVASRHLI